jgi:hypothetical protein
LNGNNHGRVFGNLRGREENIWGYFYGGTIKIPPYISLTTTEISKDPSVIVAVQMKVKVQSHFEIEGDYS